MEYRIIQGTALEDLAPFLGQLRIGTFRSYPYLYAGTMENERKYTTAFARSDHAFLCLAMDGESFGGLTTASPLDIDLQQHGLNARDFVYIGEVIVDPRYRQRGIAQELMRCTAMEAKNKGFLYTCFFCVERPEDHPQRPQDYRCPDPLWLRLGYQKTGIRMPFTWNTINAEGFDNPQENWMVLWISSLS